MAETSDWPRVVEDELNALGERDRAADGSVPPRDRRTTGYLTGLALSGGGIRSAAVSLGMLQVLAGAGVLKHFDYLSTVSGGGYIGSAMTLRLAQAADERARREETGPTDADGAFPYGEESPEVEYFRHHGNYLAPSGFGSLATGFYVVGRSVLLNLFIWIVVGGLGLALLMGLTNEAVKLFDPGQDLSPWFTRPRWGVFAWSGERWLFELLFWLAALLMGILATALVGVSLSSWWVESARAGQRPSRWKQLLPVILAAVALLLLLLVLVDGDGVQAIDVIEATWPALVLVAILVPVLCTGLARSLARDGKEGEDRISVKYARRRFQEQLAGFMLIFAGAFFALAVIPVLSDLLVGVYGSSNAAGAAIGPRLPGQGNISLPLFLVYLGSGAAALYGFYRTHLRGELGMGTAAVVIVGSVVLVFGALLIANQLAVQLFNADWPWHWWREESGAGVRRALAAVVAVMSALALAVFVNVNDLSLSRFYRDRLMEAFMPNRRQGRPVEGPAAAADRYRMSTIAAATLAVDGKPRPRRLIGPYPLVNTYVIARRFRGSGQGWDAAVRRRGGDSFVLSPLFAGSTLTKWRRTHQVLDDQLTVPTAMAISGAAVNPGGGVAGRGVTTSYATAVAMSLLSLRLGYRFRWNGSDTSFAKARRWLNPFGNHFVPGASELVLELAGIPSSRAPGFIELSDGGHFDNLGVYELVRRRCGLIVVCDGGEDPGGSYEAFTSVMTMMREDFGVKVELDRSVNGNPSGPAQLVARPRDDEYPKGADYAERGYFLATIEYGAHPGGIPERETVGPDKALVIYMKASMLKGLGLPSRGYKGANPAFPYEPTSDQFFSPEQFEAYRDVGKQIAKQMLEETELARLLGKNPPLHPPVEELLAHFAARANPVA